MLSNTLSAGERGHSHLQKKQIHTVKRSCEFPTQPAYEESMKMEKEKRKRNYSCLFYVLFFARTSIYRIHLQRQVFFECQCLILLFVTSRITRKNCILNEIKKIGNVLLNIRER